MTWTIGLGIDVLGSEKKSREGWKINDNDCSIFKRKILCVGSAVGVFPD